MYFRKVGGMNLYMYQVLYTANLQGKVGFLQMRTLNLSQLTQTLNSFILFTYSTTWRSAYFLSHRCMTDTKWSWNFLLYSNLSALLYFIQSTSCLNLHLNSPTSPSMSGKNSISIFSLYFLCKLHTSCYNTELVVKTNSWYSLYAYNVEQRLVMTFQLSKPDCK